MNTNDVNLQTILNNCVLESPIFNASGVNCTTKEELLELNKISACGAIVSKSCTLNFREGNMCPRYNDTFREGTYSINSMGIPNNGIDYYLDIINNNIGKPYFISLGGLSIEENIKLFGKISDFPQNQQICGIEYNLSCPNIIGKPQIGLDFSSMDDNLRRIFELYDKKLLPSVGIKLPPYFDPSHWQSAIDVITNYKNRLSFITTINSIGNGLVIDAQTERPVIYPKKGYGGLGGSLVKYTALANVRAFYNAFKGDIDIIGCGGVSCGQDVFEHILCGASAVQIGTHIAKFGVNQFQTIHDELCDILLQKNYKSINDFKGNLKEF